MTVTQDPRQTVLDTINLIRDRAGVPELAAIPIGVMCDPGECPIQRGLRILAADIQVFKKNMVVPNEMVGMLRSIWGPSKVKRHRTFGGFSRIKMPSHFQEFIARFDAGEWHEIAVPYGTDLPHAEPELVPDTIPDWVSQGELVLA